MDPYLESPAHFPDLHSRLVNSMSEVVGANLPDHYHAQLCEQVLLIEPDEVLNKEVGPDVTVTKDRGPGGTPVAPSANVGVLEPTTIPNIVRLDPHTEIYIEIRHLKSKELVAVVELLSPTNKSGSGRVQYIEKRESILRQRVHLIELDLLRGGKRLQLAKPLPPANYYGFVSRGNRWPNCDVYDWTVRDALPILPIPLHAPDADARLNLAEAFGLAYQRGRYDRQIKYHEPPPPPAFDTAAAEWVTQTARAAIK
jgi:hypothetical protein